VQSLKSLIRGGRGESLGEWERRESWRVGEERVLERESGVLEREREESWREREESWREREESWRKILHLKFLFAPGELVKI